MCFDPRSGKGVFQRPTISIVFIKDHVSCMSKTILISHKLIKQEPLLGNAMIVAPLMLQQSLKLQAFPYSLDPLPRYLKTTIWRYPPPTHLYGDLDPGGVCTVARDQQCLSPSMNLISADSPIDLLRCCIGKSSNRPAGIVTLSS